jgi:protein O-mannosyl-transferase
MAKKRYISNGLTNKNIYKLNYFHLFWICLALTLIVIAVYYRVWTYDFVNYDDPDYVCENQHIQAGLTFTTVKWAFTSGYAANWHPLTWLSHTLDWQIFGSNAGGHHLVNLLFHIANTLLLFIVLKQMTGALWRSAFVAALFALHPLHVESVAWVSERKDVLSTFFWILTMWMYLRYVKCPNVARYLLTLLTFALGLMAKPMLVTLPFVLLLLDYWPLVRIRQFNRQTIYRLVLEKIPFIVLSGVSSAVTFIAQLHGEAVLQLTNLSLKFRIYNSLVSYVKYIEKLIWPSRLAVFYPHPGSNVPILYAVISTVLLLAVTVFIIRYAKNHRYLITGWFWYLGTLVPVIGLVQVGNQAMADRYSYITLTGLFIIIAWGLPQLLTKWPLASSVGSRYKKIILALSALLIISSLSICTRLQLRYWQNTQTLCQHALDLTEDNYVAHSSMAEFLYKQGKLNDAIYHLSKTLQIKPDYLVAINNLGLALYKTGKIDEAIGYYKKAIEINPRDVDGHINLGIALTAKDQLAQAASEYETALNIAPENVTARKNLGAVLFQQKKFDLAAAEYRKALELKPGDPNILNALGNTLGRQGKLDEAIKFLNEAVRIKPDFAAAHANLGYALADEGKFDEAIVHFNQALRIDPNYTAARNALEAATEKQKLQKTNK